jgi:siroheme synthase-like protein
MRPRNEQSAPTSLYPVVLDVAGRRCLVVGGGPVAARKAAALVDCGAVVTVVAPSLSGEMAHLEQSLDAVERRPYQAGDAAGFRLVVTATGDPDVDAAVFADAEDRGIWCNSADDRAHSSFILPAIHRDGAVTVAVSTGGMSPALASWLRTHLGDLSGDGLGSLAQLLAEARDELRRQGRRSDSVDWTALLDGPLPTLVAAGDLDNARAIVVAAVRQ